MRKRLVDFLRWYVHESGMSKAPFSLDSIVDDYLKSDNQAPDKSQIISENEANEVFCDLCGGVIEPWSKNYTRCDKCIGLC
jgi:hypothetical protein